MAEDKDTDWGKALGVGFEIAVGTGLGSVVGYFVDKRLHTSPRGLLIGIMLGVTAGMYLLIKEANRINKG